MKAKSFIPFLVVTTLLLVGCSIDELFNPDPSTANTIRFTTRLPATRAAAYEETGDNAYKSMGVYAVLGFGNILTNQKVEREAGSSGWHYSPLASWPSIGEAVSFYAYAPYNAITPTSEEGLEPILENFIVAATADGKAENQIDLLMAEAVTNTNDTLNDAVQLTMRHVLTRVCFSARTQHPYASGVTSVQITNITLTGLDNQGTHKLDAAYTWEPPVANVSKDNYELTTAGGGLNPVNLSNTAMTNITTDDGNLYLMPQVLKGNPEINITVSTTNGIGQVDKTYSFYLTDLLDEFKQGESLRFLLTVPNAADPEQFQIEVLHADWNAEYNIDATIDSDPVLYISNETVYTYDGAVACVYFSSNIPPNAINHPINPHGFNDIIYIEDQGRVGSNTGATFSVADEFYAIAKNDPDREKIKLDQGGPHINNLRYEKDPVTPGLYKGHLDIVQRKTTTAGETSNQGKQPLILKLHVGKLVRDITVQRVVTTESAKQNPTRYVGTFHRHHETGERIVTWHEDENTRWRVEIDGLGKSDDIAQLQIDTRISPDFRNKQLYSLVARDPEGTRVEHSDNLFGCGRVYFRVGWKTPTEGVTNRYARIKVRLWKNGKKPTDANGVDIEADDTHYLYCRQGDTEEKIATADSRYALYNVLTPGEFVRYPTQTGMLYQWNRLVPWSPLGEAPPYGWNSNTNDFETDFDYQRSACPDGYVYPSTLQQTEMKAVFGDGNTGTPTARGYYADGYFDRRTITYNGATSTVKNEHRVNASNIEVAAVGTILFNNGQLGFPDGKARSIFLVSGGYRNVDQSYGGLDGGLIANQNHGVHGGYWFDMSDGTTDKALGALIFRGTTKDEIRNYPKRNAHSLRCIRDTSWLFVFNANGGENGPRNMTIPSRVTTITIPNIVPNNYYRDYYVFKGWTVNRNGSGTLYTAGQTGIAPAAAFGAATNPAKWVELYAKWELPTTKVDFLASGVNASYFVAPNSPDPYVGLTRVSNGTPYAASLPSLTDYITSSDKAYPVLEFSGKLSAPNWATAYDACLAMGTGWRLPRVQEIAMLFFYKTNIGATVVDELLGGPNDQVGGSIWTGTDSTTSGGALRSYRVSNSNYILSLSKADATISYRCVRASTP